MPDRVENHEPVGQARDRTAGSQPEQDHAGALDRDQNVAEHEEEGDGLDQVRAIKAQGLGVVW